ncbi:MAG: septum site-determining protein MinC [Pseudomonadota bacterium]|nr:septum site-determining protein MinC [Pseudomonadota bacterium]
MAIVLAPEPPVEEWLAVLDAEIARAPGFFAGRPTVVDLSLVPPDLAETLVSDLRGARGIRVIGIEGVGEQGPGSWGLPLMLSGGREHRLADAPAPPEGEPDAAATVVTDHAPPELAPSLIVDRPVRSGQTVVFESGDVTVIGSVASGAEVVAGGSIHVYGALRGRAVAGLLEGQRARIFCGRLEAELLAIEGVYRTADEMDSAMQGRTVQAWLEDGELRLAALG